MCIRDRRSPARVFAASGLKRGATGIAGSFLAGLDPPTWRAALGLPPGCFRSPTPGDSGGGSCSP
eukprot:9509316-Alexandrium_andersonii.AAC.1